MIHKKFIVSFINDNMKRNVFFRIIKYLFLIFALIFSSSDSDSQRLLRGGLRGVKAARTGIKLARASSKIRKGKKLGKLKIFKKRKLSQGKSSIKDRILSTYRKYLDKRSGVSYSKILNSASSTYKGSTVLGHSLSKHSGRNPSIWGKLTGNPSKWHSQAKKHFDDIMNAPGVFNKTTTKEGINFLEKRLPDKRGIRLNMDETFKGFID